jgi:hypothetical protein
MNATDWRFVGTIASAAVSAFLSGRATMSGEWEMALLAGIVVLLSVTVGEMLRREARMQALQSSGTAE